MKNFARKLMFFLPLGLLVTLLAVLLTACSVSVPPTPTLQGDPPAPTTENVKPVEPTPTPEIFIPLNPSPTSSGSNLPLTCQVTDLSVFIDQGEGYCFAYPNRFMLGESPILDVETVHGLPVDNGPDQVAATFGVQVSAFNAAQSLADQADQFLKDFTSVDPKSLPHTDLTVGGEPAIGVDMVPVQLSWRIVFVAHGDRLYRLMYWPVDVPAAQVDLEELYQTTLNSFAFLPSESGATPPGASTAQPEIFEGVNVSYGPVRLVIPPGLATGVQGSQYPRQDSPDAAWFDKTPGYTLLVLNDYILVGKSLQPQIFVYPAQGYGELNSVTAQSIQRLQTILDTPNAPIDGGQLPVIPFFNSIPVYSADPQVVAFQNGKGVRYLTQYGQYAAPANNQELFYTFHGLTNDGANYIIAIFPITAPGLGESSDPNAAVPISGVNYPGMGAPGSDFKTYYSAVTDLLNGTPPKAFNPTLAQLDVLIASMQIIP